MTRLLATELALPEREYPQEVIARRIGAWLEQHGHHPDRVLAILANSGVERRRSAFDLDELFAPRRMGARNAAYAAAALELGERAARRALEASALDPRELALICSVSCTGFMIPSLDAHLVNRLPLRADVRRLPLTLLGCAGGAMGLAHTALLLEARPREAALLVAVELPSQSLQSEDLSMAHLVSCALFGDGAAAVVLAGRERPVPAARSGEPRRPRPHVLASGSSFFHGTLDAMGFDVRDSGFHMVLDRRIPELVSDTIWPAIERWVAAQGVDLRELDHFLVHPGGRRVLDAVEACLGRGPGAVEHSRAVLREQGNLSSVAVLSLLERVGRLGAPRAGQRGLLVAFGPGFNAEHLLLEWRP